jgi:HAD superfamily hydrolase (TIGR01484 family)
LGRPFAHELQELPQTYSECLSFDIASLSAFIREASSSHLITTGSGGSLSAAFFLSGLHQHYAERIAKVVTPLELAHMNGAVRDTVVCLISASGRNNDILSAYRIAALQEPPGLLSLCSKLNSPLSALAQEYEFATNYEFSLALKKDGFLATNSLLAFFTLLARAYAEAFGDLDPLPSSKELWAGISDLQYLSRETTPLWSRETLIVLYDPALHSAAVDIESKFTEAALGVIQLADFRNFGHGRHHWLAKHGNTSGVIALYTEQHENLAQRTLSLLPNSIPRLPLRFDGAYSIAAIRALLTVFYLTHLAGNARGIDPGRPGVPDFGRKLYHLGGAYKIVQQRLERDIRSTAIARKTHALPKSAMGRESTQFWQFAHDKFIDKLRSASIRAIVFDYDGTLCDRQERFGILRPEITKQLIRLLEGGIHIGVATGRGRSVREALRQAIPDSLWSGVTIGYYNGADCASLTDQNSPDVMRSIDEHLRDVAELASVHPRWSEITSITVRPSQITFEPINGASIEELWQVISSEVEKFHDVDIVRSTHSIDILAPGVSKVSVVDLVSRLSGSRLDEILCIGDQGLWPGNDYELLSQPLGLSVDAVSLSTDTCWNLAPPGCKGVSATLYYLRCIHISPVGALITQANFRREIKA